MATFKFTGGVSHFSEKLVEGMVERGYPREFAERTFRQLEGFGSYGFPESHAASFAKIAYASSWMKCHHPNIFCAALLNAQPMGFYAPAQIVRDARDHGVEVRPVCINTSRWDCTLEPNNGRYLAVRLPPPPGVKSAVVNVRNYASPFWRTAPAKPERRCLVPVTEFQEWSVEPDLLTGKKTKHWFTVPSRPIFAFAGVWRPTEQGAAYAFLTCGYDGDPAGHVVGAIHPKAMPVILHEEDFDRWLQSPIDEAIPLACALTRRIRRTQSSFRSRR